jgi:hypothetical protein
MCVFVRARFCRLRIYDSVVLSVQNCRVHFCPVTLREIGWGGMDWIDLAQDRDQWRAPVNTLMNLQVP